jgi:aryl-alcohol dehydrogenase-like predicted oxidoreductase/nucleoside-diphosphate-sugar epimerase
MRVFVTGASGFVGSAVVQELIGAGHRVLGLARSDASAKAVAAAGAEVHRGTVEDLDNLRRGATACDAVIHTAFIHDFSKFKENCEIDRRAIAALGDALKGSDRRLIITSGTGVLGGGRSATEDDKQPSGPNAVPRVASEEAADAVQARGVRVSTVRLPPTVHGDGDHGFVPMLIGIARQKGVAAYVGEGDNRWAAVHRLDAAHLYRLVIEKGTTGARYHAVGEEGVPFREIADVIGRKLNVPVVGKSPDEAAAHFGFLAHFAAGDLRASSARTQELLGWRPRQVGLVADLEGGRYSYSSVAESPRLPSITMTNQTTLGGRFTFPGTNLSVSRMGYGAMQLAGPHVFGPPRDPDGAVAVLKEALAAGVDHIDTSDFYGPHVTNQIIKRALHPYPKELVIVTKVGARRGNDASWLPAQSPDELRSAVEDNLRNLGADALDIVNLRVGLMTLGDESIETRVRVLVDLKKQKLIRHIGLSNVTAKQFAEARRLTEIVCVQNQYNLAHRLDDAFIDQLAKEGVAYVPFFPLGGFTPLQSSALSEVAKSLEATPMQVALAWLLHRAPNILLIPGTSSLAHLRENLRAAELKLSPAALEKLNTIRGTEPR